MATSASVLSQTTATAQPANRIKAKVTKIGLSNEITVTLPNRDIYHGSVDDIGDDAFRIAEVDLQKVLEFKYAEVKKVDRGYGHTRGINGQRIPPRRNYIWMALCLGLLTIPVLIFAATDR